MTGDFRRADRDVPLGVLNEEGPWNKGRDPRRGKAGGDGSRNPWMLPPRRRPGRPGGPGRPLLEEWLRRGRLRLARIGGGGGMSGGRPLWGYVLAALVLFWLALTCFHRIDPQERGVITRLGRYVGTLGPGAALTLPAPFDVVTRVNVDDVKSIDMPASGGGSLLLTRDRDLVDIGYTVRWSVRDPALYLFNVSGDAQEMIRDAAASAMRGTIGSVTLDEATGATQGAIEARAAGRLQRLLDGYRSGVAVQGVVIRRAVPPQQVGDAVKDVTAAQSSARTAIAEARRDANDIVTGAQAQAAAFDKAYESYRMAPQVTRTRMYYDTMDAVMAKTDKIIVDGASANVALPPAVRKAAPQPQQGDGQ